MLKAFAGVAVGWATALLAFVLWASESKSSVPSPVASPHDARVPLASAGPAEIANPAIDMQGHLEIANEAAAYRVSHRITEEEFLRMSREPGTIVLDARSRAKFDALHIKGAVNLSFADISIPTLKTTLPDKLARILIYCNNNFTNADVPFPPKSPFASLNLSTFITLYGYGYRNVYELGPLLDIDLTMLPMASTPPSRTD